MFESIKNLFNPRHVVVVDDDKDILRIFGDVLEKKKYTVTRAANFKELGDLNDYKEDGEKTADLFLLDIFIKPSPTGLEIAKIIRAEKIDVPICFITGKGCSIAEEKHLTSILPDVYLIQKPITPTAMLAKVAELISMYE